MTAVIPGKGELSMLYASLIVKVLSVGNIPLRALTAVLAGRRPRPRPDGCALHGQVACHPPDLRVVPMRAASERLASGYAPRSFGPVARRLYVRGPPQPSAP